jgi:osomolarity two-component system response regulator SKN7
MCLNCFLILLGMNDVLPKPFTKEGLLQMLEKHLAHLKKPVAHVDGMVAPQPLAATRQVLKEEESPVKSPATASNWNSPNQITGVSPVTSNVTDEYMQAVQGHPAHPTHPAHPAHPAHSAHPTHPAHPGAYAVNPMQANIGYSTSPQIAMQSRAQAGHRRQISDISGGDDMNNPAKRQQVYGAPLQPQPLNPMQRPR